VLLTDGDAVTLVDTGYPGDRDRLLASLVKIRRGPADVAAVLLTHAHPDHLGSAEYFRSALAKPVLVHEDEVDNATGRRIEQVSKQTVLRHAWRPSVMLWARDVIALDAEKVDRMASVDTFGGEALDVPGRPRPVHTPGHTSGHCVLHLPDRGVLLAGDALMTGHALARSAGPQLMPDFFNNDSARARDSLHLVADLEAEVLVPGHGPAFRGSPVAAVAAALAPTSARRTAASPRAARITYGADLPVQPAEAFAFVSDPRNWPTFVDALQSADRDDDWGEAGGHGRMTTRFRGRTIDSTMELTVWDPPREFRYVSRQPGAPDIDNRRVFEPTPGGTRLRGTTETVPRAGMGRVSDRAQLLLLRRVYAGAMKRLPDVIGRGGPPGKGR
jgi:glyoxylase-like metal-dependent hydrolase (beta-lactamase superfamily II)